MLPDAPYHCRHRPRSLVQGGYTSQVARIQSQLIASWVGEGETTANSLPNPRTGHFNQWTEPAAGHGD
jgi:hypothetical protein